MSNIINNADKADELTEVNRSQIEHRALWMALIFDEIKKAGHDAEGITRRAIKRCGIIHGEIFKKDCPENKTCEDFHRVFPPLIAEKSFNMHPINASRDELSLDFNYCALVSAWKKLGLDDETCDLLCDIAMEGDRGIAEAMGFKLELTDTIAKGCKSCKLKFIK